MTTKYSQGWVPFSASVGLFLASILVVAAFGQPRLAKEEDDDNGGHDHEDDYEHHIWPRYHNDDYDYGDDDDDDDDDDDRKEGKKELEDLRKQYRSRRVYDRLSYENVQDFLVRSPKQPPQQQRPLEDEGSSHGPCFGSTLSFGDDNELTVKRSNSNQPGKVNKKPSSTDVATSTVLNASIRTQRLKEMGLSEWDIQHRTRRGRSPVPILERRDSQASLVAPHPNADYDFHPKNRNWRHFEHFNEKDPRRQQQLLQQQQQSLSSATDLCATPIPRSDSIDTSTTVTEDPYNQEEKVVQVKDTEKKPSPHGDDHHDEDDIETTANSISSSGSDSSEEQFVWMKHSHRRKGSTAPPLIEKIGMWKVPSFLSLFVEPEPETDPPAPVMTTDRNNVAPEKEEPSSNSPPDEKRKSSDKASNARRNGIPTASPSNPSEASSVRDGRMSFTRVLERFFSSGSSTQATPHHTSSPIEPKSSRELGLSSVPSRMTTSGGTHHRQLRAQYNASIMPEKVILIRHGQSMGNINELLYSTTPDNAMPLTPLGWVQAREAGQILKDKILTSGQTVHFIVSPYVRTVETFHGMVSAWCDPKEFKDITDKEQRIKAWYRRLMEMGLTWNEDSRIREQDFGNYQDPDTIRKAKQERHRFGVFYYRFPYGESASDVFDRVSTFLDSLWRSFEMSKSQNYVLVTHGISIRVLLARYFRYTIDQFNILANPRNCEMIILGHNGEGRLELQGRCALELGPSTTNGGTTSITTKDLVPPPNDKGTESTDERDIPTKEESGKNEDLNPIGVTGYRFHKRLRIVPKNAIRKVKIRISPDD